MTYSYDISVGANSTKIDISLDFTKPLFTSSTSASTSNDTEVEFDITDDPELQKILFNDEKIKPILDDIDTIVNVKNSNSMDQMFDNLFFESEDVNYDNFNGRGAIDWVNGDTLDEIDDGINHLPEKTSDRKVLLGPLDAPIEPLLFPSFFSTLKKMGLKSFSYASRFIKQNNSSEIVPQYKFMKPKKNNYGFNETLFNQHKEDLVDVADVLNDFNPIKSDVNVPWDCGDDNMGCELVELALGVLGEKKIESFINSHKNDTPSYTETHEDGIHSFVEITAFPDDNVFQNSNNITIENFPNGDSILQTKQTIPLEFKPINDLPNVIKNDLNIKGDEYANLIKSQEQLSLQAHNDYLKQLPITQERRTVFLRSKVNISDKRKKYFKQLNIENGKWNTYVRSKRKESAFKKRRFEDVKLLLNKMIGGTCMNAEKIKDSINNSYGDILTNDAIEIFNEHIDAKKIPTKCCLQVCCNPCKYKLEK